MSERADTRPELTTRRLGHAVVDTALLVLALAVIALVLAVAPGPEVCAASLPTPGPCFSGDRQLIALVTVLGVGLVAIAGVIANHLLRGRRRRGALIAATGALLVLGLLGAASLYYSFWIIRPVTPFI